MRFNENETYKFVKMYLSHEYLWNSEHPNYRLKNKRQKAYNDIRAEFHRITGIALTEIEVKMKIKNLRSTYVQELAKIKRRSCPDSNYTPAMKWFAEWHKHMSVLKRSKYDISINNEDEAADDSCQQVWVSPDEDDVDPDPFVSQTNDDYIIMLKSEPTEDSTKISSDIRLSEIKKKKNKHYRSPSIDNSDRTYRGSLDSNSEHGREDEFDIYGKYIATQLRKMDLQKALRVQLEIQSIVSEARISGLSND